MIHSVNANSLRSFINVDSGPHHNEILNFKTDNSHWGSGHYCMQGGLRVRSHSHKQPAE